MLGYDDDNNEKLIELTKSDIEMCKQYDFDVLIPSNLKDEIESEDTDKESITKIENLE